MGNVRVRILPEREKILIRDFGFPGFAGKRVGTAETEMRKHAERSVDYNSPVIQDF